MERLADFAPVGRNLKKDGQTFAVALGVSGFVSLGYYASLIEALDAVQRGYRDVMTPFVEVLGHWLGLFPVVAILCLTHSILYYRMHHGSSQSIYLMRRLPDRFSLHRRCLTLPVVTALLSLLLAGGLLWIDYALYCHFTPQDAFVPGQWALLWDTWTAKGGVL